MTIQTITPEELEQRRRQGQHIDLVDVRTPREYEAVHAEGARSVPLDALDPQQVVSGRTAGDAVPLYLICQSGGRSRSACQRLQQAGLSSVVNVEGGTNAWVQAGLPTVRGSDPGTARSPWLRRIGLVVVLAGLILGWLVNPWFSLLSIVTWVGLIVAGGGACPLGTCAVPDRARHQSS